MKLSVTENKFHNITTEASSRLLHREDPCSALCQADPARRINPRGERHQGLESQEVLGQTCAGEELSMH